MPTPIGGGRGAVDDDDDTTALLGTTTGDDFDLNGDDLDVFDDFEDLMNQPDDDGDGDGDGGGDGLGLGGQITALLQHLNDELADIRRNPDEAIDLSHSSSSGSDNDDDNGEDGLYKDIVNGGGERTKALGDADAAADDDSRTPFGTVYGATAKAANSTAGRSAEGGVIINIGPSPTKGGGADLSVAEKRRLMFGDDAVSASSRAGSPATTAPTTKPTTTPTTAATHAKVKPTLKAVARRIMLGNRVAGAWTADSLNLLHAEGAERSVRFIMNHSHEPFKMKRLVANMAIYCQKHASAVSELLDAGAVDALLLLVELYATPESLLGELAGDDLSPPKVSAVRRVGGRTQPRTGASNPPREGGATAAAAVAKVDSEAGQLTPPTATAVPPTGAAGGGGDELGAASPNDPLAGTRRRGTSVPIPISEPNSPVVGGPRAGNAPLPAVAASSSIRRTSSSAGAIGIGKAPTLHTHTLISNAAGTLLIMAAKRRPSAFSLDHMRRLVSLQVRKLTVLMEAAVVTAAASSYNHVPHALTASPPQQGAALGSNGPLVHEGGGGAPSANASPPQPLMQESTATMGVRRHGGVTFSLSPAHLVQPRDVGAASSPSPSGQHLLASSLQQQQQQLSATTLFSAIRNNFIRNDWGDSAIYTIGMWSPEYLLDASVLALVSDGLERCRRRVDHWRKVCTTATVVGGGATAGAASCSSSSVPKASQEGGMDALGSTTVNVASSVDGALFAGPQVEGSAPIDLTDASSLLANGYTQRMRGAACHWGQGLLLNQSSRWLSTATAALLEIDGEALMNSIGFAPCSKKGSGDRKGGLASTSSGSPTSAGGTDASLTRLPSVGVQLLYVVQRSLLQPEADEAAAASDGAAMAQYPQQQLIGARSPSMMGARAESPAAGMGATYRGEQSPSASVRSFALNRNQWQPDTSVGGTAIGTGGGPLWGAAPNGKRPPSSAVAAPHIYESLSLLEYLIDVDEDNGFANMIAVSTPNFTSASTGATFPITPMATLVFSLLQFLHYNVRLFALESPNKDTAKLPTAVAKATAILDRLLRVPAVVSSAVLPALQPVMCQGLVAHCLSAMVAKAGAVVPPYRPSADAALVQHTGQALPATEARRQEGAQAVAGYIAATTVVTSDTVHEGDQRSPASAALGVMLGGGGGAAGRGSSPSQAGADGLLLGITAPHSPFLPHAYMYAAKDPVDALLHSFEHNQHLWYHFSHVMTRIFTQVLMPSGGGHSAVCLLDPSAKARFRSLLAGKLRNAGALMARARQLFTPSEDRASRRLVAAHSRSSRRSMLGGGLPRGGGGGGLGGTVSLAGTVRDLASTVQQSSVTAGSDLDLASRAAAQSAMLQDLLMHLSLLLGNWCHVYATTFVAGERCVNAGEVPCVLFGIAATSTMATELMSEAASAAKSVAVVNLNATAVNNGTVGGSAVAAGGGGDLLLPMYSMSALNTQLSALGRMMSAANQMPTGTTELSSPQASALLYKGYNSLLAIAVRTCRALMAALREMNSVKGGSWDVLQLDGEAVLAPYGQGTTYLHIDECGESVVTMASRPASRIGQGYPPMSPAHRPPMRPPTPTGTVRPPSASSHHHAPTLITAAFSGFIRMASRELVDYVASTTAEQQQQQTTITAATSAAAVDMSVTGSTAASPPLVAIINSVPPSERQKAVNALAAPLMEVLGDVDAAIHSATAAAAHTSSVSGAAMGASRGHHNASVTTMAGDYVGCFMLAQQLLDIVGTHLWAMVLAEGAAERLSGGLTTARAHAPQQQASAAATEEEAPPGDVPGLSSFSPILNRSAIRRISATSTKDGAGGATRGGDDDRFEIVSDSSDTFTLASSQTTLHTNAHSPRGGAAEVTEDADCHESVAFAPASSVVTAMVSAVARLLPAGNLSPTDGGDRAMMGGQSSVAHSAALLFSAVCTAAVSGGGAAGAGASASNTSFSAGVNASLQQLIVGGGGGGGRAPKALKAWLSDMLAYTLQLMCRWPGMAASLAQQTDAVDQAMALLRAVAVGGGLVGTLHQSVGASSMLSGGLHSSAPRLSQFTWEHHLGPLLALVSRCCAAHQPLRQRLMRDTVRYKGVPAKRACEEAGGPSYADLPSFVASLLTVVTHRSTFAVPPSAASGAFADYKARLSSTVVAEGGQHPTHPRPPLALGGAVSASIAAHSVTAGALMPLLLTGTPSIEELGHVGAVLAVLVTPIAAKAPLTSLWSLSKEDQARFVKASTAVLLAHPLVVRVRDASGLLPARPSSPSPSSGGGSSDALLSVVTTNFWRMLLESAGESPEQAQQSLLEEVARLRAAVKTMEAERVAAKEENATKGAESAAAAPPSPRKKEEDVTGAADDDKPLALEFLSALIRARNKGGPSEQDQCNGGLASLESEETSQRSLIALEGLTALFNFTVCGGEGPSGPAGQGLGLAALVARLAKSLDEAQRACDGEQEAAAKAQREGAEERRAHESVRADLAAQLQQSEAVHTATVEGLRHHIADLEAQVAAAAAAEADGSAAKKGDVNTSYGDETFDEDPVEEHAEADEGGPKEDEPCGRTEASAVEGRSPPPPRRVGGSAVAMHRERQDEELIALGVELRMAKEEALSLQQALDQLKARMGIDDGAAEGADGGAEPPAADGDAATEGDGSEPTTAEDRLSAARNRPIPYKALNTKSSDLPPGAVLDDDTCDRIMLYARHDDHEGLVHMAGGMMTAHRTMTALHSKYRRELRDSAALITAKHERLKLLVTEMETCRRDALLLEPLRRDYGDLAARYGALDRAHRRLLSDLSRVGDGADVSKVSVAATPRRGGGDTPSKAAGTPSSTTRPLSHHQHQEQMQQHSLQADRNRAVPVDEKDLAKYHEALAARRLEVKLKALAQRNDRLAKELKDKDGERVRECVEGVEARQQLRHVTLQYDNDRHGMTWANGRMRRLEKERALADRQRSTAQRNAVMIAKDCDGQLKRRDSYVDDFKKDCEGRLSAITTELASAKKVIEDQRQSIARYDQLVARLQSRVDGGGGGHFEDRHASFQHPRSTSSASARATPQQPSSSRPVSAAYRHGKSATPTSTSASSMGHNHHNPHASVEGDRYQRMLIANTPRYEDYRDYFDEVEADDGESDDGEGLGDGALKGGDRRPSFRVPKPSDRPSTYDPNKDVHLKSFFAWKNINVRRGKEGFASSKDTASRMSSAPAGGRAASAGGFSSNRRSDPNANDTSRDDGHESVVVRRPLAHTTRAASSSNVHRRRSDSPLLGPAKIGGSNSNGSFRHRPVSATRRAE